MNKLLIGIKSCRRDRERRDHDVIRKTWGLNLSGADLYFFEGDTSFSPWTINYLNEIALECPDGYDFLTLKTIEICRFTLNAGYEFCFLADTDTYIRPDFLMKTGFEDFDYYGLSRPTERIGTQFHYTAVDRAKKAYDLPNTWAWCSGGYGYFLSRRAMEAVLEAPKPTTMPLTWCEDMFVGQVVGPLHVAGKLKMGNALNFMNKVTFHFPQYRYQSQYDPKFGWMERTHSEQVYDR